MSAVSDYLKKDRIVRAMSESGSFRIAAGSFTATVREAVKRHRLNPAASLLLAEMLCGTALAASFLKGEENLTFVLQSETAGNVTAEANAAGEIRGYSSRPAPIIRGDDRNEIMASLVEGGTFQCTRILAGRHEPIVSSVPVESGNIAAIFTDYYLRSEQISAAMRLHVTLDSDFSIPGAYGLMVEALPGAGDNEITAMEAVIAESENLHEAFLQAGSAENLLASVFEIFSPVNTGGRPVHFYCRCSEKRFLNALAMLDLNELKEMAAEEKQVLTCHFCAEEYIIPGEKIEVIYRQRLEGE